MRSIRFMRVIAGLFAGTLFGLVGANLYRDLSLTVNGKPSPKPPILQDGELYVPVGALKDAGAEVVQTGDHLSIVFGGPGIAAPGRGAEGGLDEWLFDGLWRIKVSGLTLADGSVTLALEIANSANIRTYPAITGVAEVQLYNDKSVRLILSTASEDAWSELKSYDYAPGASMLRTLKFDAKTSAPPATLLVTVVPNAESKAF